MDAEGDTSDLANSIESIEASGFQELAISTKHAQEFTSSSKFIKILFIEFWSHSLFASHSFFWRQMCIYKDIRHWSNLFNLERYFNFLE